ncbi:putative lipase [Gordonia rhizosphera NBRC 16068]|uniref:Putative lipase n=1 Tax=Gordonia rhizosphera NBRC 16068 TaxID=1108045 RepID=K6UZL5_9ACTN|nr:putative lipase [Gordonia rhizosphera NBRC 16068]
MFLRCRTAATVLVTAVAAATLAATAGTAAADPPNLGPVPPQLPHLINGVVPAPSVPQLRTIPLRARAAGFDHRILELREAVLPLPTGDPIFDRWPDDLPTMAPGEIIATRDVTVTAAPVVTTSIRSATLVKFRNTDATDNPTFGTATVLVPRTPYRGPRPVVVNNVPIDSLGTDRESFGASRIAMTGYSGGAIATNGAAKLLNTYAPELAGRVVGATLGGVPADFRMLAGSMNAKPRDRLLPRGHAGDRPGTHGDAVHGQRVRAMAGDITAEECLHAPGRVRRRDLLADAATVHRPRSVPFPGGRAHLPDDVHARPQVGGSALPLSRHLRMVDPRAGRAESVRRTMPARRPCDLPRGVRRARLDRAARLR